MQNNLFQGEVKTQSQFNTSTPISAFITNLGKYNEGELVGKWHSFPTTKKELRQTFREIGIDGKRYEEYFVTDYEAEIDGLYDCLPEYANLDELNYLASKIDELSEYEIETLEAAIEYGDYASSIKDIINLTENLDCYDFLSGINNENDLGYYWIEDSGCYDLDSMGNLARYFDYERFGRDIALDEGGTFTKNGYIRNNGDSFNEEYDGVNIPKEYKVFAFPKEKKRDNFER